MARREERAFYLFISPWIVGFILFSAGPAIGSCVISFTQWSLLSTPSWTGTSNYQRLVGDPLFWQALTNTLAFAAGSVGLGTAFALLLALLLNQDVKGQALVRTIFYLPAVVSGVAVAILWRYLYNPDYGLVNSILHLVGIKSGHRRRGGFAQVLARDGTDDVAGHLLQPHRGRDRLLPGICADVHHD